MGLFPVEPPSEGYQRQGPPWRPSPFPTPHRIGTVEGKPPSIGDTSIRNSGSDPARHRTLEGRASPVGSRSVHPPLPKGLHAIPA